MCCYLLKTTTVGESVVAKSIRTQQISIYFVNFIQYLGFPQTFFLNKYFFSLRHDSPLLYGTVPLFRRTSKPGVRNTPAPGVKTATVTTRKANRRRTTVRGKPFPITPWTSPKRRGRRRCATNAGKLTVRIPNSWSTWQNTPGRNRTSVGRAKRRSGRKSVWLSTRRSTLVRTFETEAEIVKKLISWVNFTDFAAFVCFLHFYFSSKHIHARCRWRL